MHLTLICITITGSDFIDVQEKVTVKGKGVKRKAESSIMKNSGLTENGVDHLPEKKANLSSDNETCPFCFLQPCITALYHDWLGNGRDACEANSGIPRAKYMRYWKCISNSGRWYLDM